MVERTEAQGFDEFTGLVENVELEVATEEDRQDQYHITIDPIDVQVQGKTGKMHEWIRIPGSSTKSSVPQGSVIDAYIRALERLDGAVKKLKDVSEVFAYMKGRKFKFNREKLGKAFGDYKAADYWVPVSLLKD